MSKTTIRKGLDLPIDGQAALEIANPTSLSSIGINPIEFKSVKPKLLVTEGQTVKGGSPVFFDKKRPYIKIVSPVPGTISKINWGPRRTINSIEITPDLSGEYETFEKMTSESIDKLDRNEALSLLQGSGTFAFLRQRPFDIIPNIDHIPKAIFINAMNTAPNAGNPGFSLAFDDTKECLELGVKILQKLTSGKIHLSHHNDEHAKIFTDIYGVEKHSFEGPHPAGLTSTHIHFIDPINKGEVVWHIDATRLYNLGSFLKNGNFDSRQIVCTSGTGLKDKKYFHSYIGAKIGDIVNSGFTHDDVRIIDGTVLYGDQKEQNSYLSFYSQNIQVIKEGRAKRFLGWMMPGTDLYSASSKVFLSAIAPKKAWDFNTNLNGGHRAIVWTDVYDKVMPLDIYTNFLIKAVMAEDIEEAEKLGILEVAPEDFALATYICPSKTDLCSIINSGLELIEQEGY